jgi:predicted TIM-barrel fold metal-dependent hydrolase
VQPIDAPDEMAGLVRLIEHLESDDLFLFSTDYPHWQFDGDDALPPELSGALLRKILCGNALATYPRLAKVSRTKEIDA